MQVYDPPLRDMRFVLHELSRDDGFGALAGLEAISPDLADAVLEEAARFSREVLVPLNRVGDEAGCRIEADGVRTPAGFVEAYRAFREGGWVSLAGNPEWGGQGLPDSIGKLVEEMTTAANLSFSSYPGLTYGAIAVVDAHAEDDLKRAWLPRMISGEWTGTMCLTEAHCGTDLGLLRTRAVPLGDGAYAIAGAKIFISAGEHDLADNIVHLVLARLPDAPAGIRGISLFLVPRFLLDADGNPATRNAVTCTAIEHKMGLKASATCQLAFDDATGWLIGEPHKGMAAMFTMMNSERLSVGIQGLGIGEAAYQAAVWYARERTQGRSPAGARHPEQAADPIIVHPDVRRMLMTMRANNDGCRALGGWVARALDAERHAEDPEIRAKAGDFVALMTPVVKALFTDLGFESASLAVQVYGGHGYIRESGVEQYLRDARIGMIYEGTNGVQALDLVGRKLPAAGGRAFRGFLSAARTFAEAQGANPALAGIVPAFADALDELDRASVLIAAQSQRDAEDSAAGASEFLRLFGLVALGFCHARAALVASAALADGSGETGFYGARIASAEFFAQRILPQVTPLRAAIAAGKATVMALSEADF
jgi:alkylation response protein AidB-like acyl-CoA dehydrogenase